MALDTTLDLGIPKFANAPEVRRLHAATEVARPIAFATVIVIAVFLPLFGMTGIEGRMYHAAGGGRVDSQARAPRCRVRMSHPTFQIERDPSCEGTEQAAT
jgi:hypothetical protein